MGKESDKKAKSHHHSSSSSSKSKSKSKSKSSSSSHKHHHQHGHEPSRLEVYVMDDRPDERFAQGMPSGRGDRATDMAQWDARYASASKKK